MFSWRQVGLISFGAIALLAGLHFAQSRPALSHLDFIPGGLEPQEFCDPKTPRALELSRLPPAILTVIPTSSPLAGRTIQVVLKLQTASGKPIGHADLVSPGQIDLRIAGPSSGDLRSLAAEPGQGPDDWVFPFSPRDVGSYRIAADFTPVATGTKIAASAEVTVTAP